MPLCLRLTLGLAGEGGWEAPCKKQTKGAVQGDIWLMNKAVSIHTGKYIKI